MNKTLRIFNIQRYSLHDGEGIRTVFFLKGCPLRCRWCCNPESQNPNPEIMYRRKLCIGCEACGHCREWNQTIPDVIRFDEEKKCCIAFSKLKGSSLNPAVCPSGAISTVGEDREIEELLDLAEQDAVFYGSDGGITVSGGEPLMQENTVLFLKRAKERYLNTAIETCGYVPVDRFLKAAEYLDQIFMDIKSLDDEKHMEYTGVSGALIRKNLDAVASAFPKKNITVRTPVIPGFNDRPEELRAIEQFLHQYPNVTWETLPYHEYGVGKYEMLGREYHLQ